MSELKYSFSKFQLSLGIFIGGFLLLALLTMSDYGLSWDEPTRWRSGDVKLDYYEQLFGSGDFLATLQTAPNDVYPGLYDIPLGLARRYSGVDAILLSRIWNAFFGCLSIVLTILIARKFIPARSTEESSKGFRSSLDFLMPFLAGFCLLCNRCPPRTGKRRNQRRLSAGEFPEADERDENSRQYWRSGC